VDKKERIKKQLRQAGFKATPARVALLALLEERAKPLEVSVIMGQIKVEADQATVYRALRLLAQAGLVRRVQMQAGAAHYEFAALPHHHHLICEKCGLVEDVMVCCDNQRPLVASFSQVTNHNLEYSGICNDCV